MDPFRISSSERPHSPPEVFTACCHSSTPAVKPRSRSGSTSIPNVIESSVTPGPLSSPSGVTGVISTVVVVGAVVAAALPVGPDGRSSAESQPARARRTTSRAAVLRTCVRTDRGGRETMAVRATVCWLP